MDCLGTNQVDEHSFVYRNKHIHLVDTPGFDDTTRTDREVLDDIATWLGTAYSFDIKLAGILYLHRVTDIKMGGVASSNLRMFKKLCGERFYPRVTLVGTMWDVVDRATAEARETELKRKDDFWGRMIKGGSQVRRHWNTRESAMDILDGLIGDGRTNDAPTHMRVQTEMVKDGLTVEETSAGQEVLSKILEERKDYEKKLKTAVQEMKEALEERDTQAAIEIQKEKEKWEAKLNKGYEDQAKLNVKFEDMVRQQREKFEEMERKEAKLKSELAAAKAAREELERKQADVSRTNPGSYQALQLRQEVDNARAAEERVGEDLRKTEEFVATKKKSWSKPFHSIERCANIAPNL
jgi:hypothetical protein